ncbi:hypothetical protein, partial [Bacteroides acidifaciens]|uniref:hypothetical protein n=1 Tax=Bacteroides acidifaciens TaxID=85831 RepID=UPI0025B18450
SGVKPTLAQGVIRVWVFHFIILYDIGFEIRSLEHLSQIHICFSEIITTFADMVNLLLFFKRKQVWKQKE